MNFNNEKVCQVIDARAVFEKKRRREKSKKVSRVKIHVFLASLDPALFGVVLDVALQEAIRRAHA